tara:strand:- start:326 stop:571 length:246 start_codon:yes stop_codon:yes gene_type:complete
MSWINILLNPKNAGKAYNAYKNVKPLSKIKGAMSVSDVKNKASLFKLKTAGDAAIQRLKDTTKSLNKVNKTIKDQQKILDK